MAKRQKQVFKNGEIGHPWAHAAQAEGRTANRPDTGWGRGGSTTLFFEGPHMYSYGKHYQVAQRIVRADGAVGFLFNSESSTPTTNRASSRVRSAARGNGPIFDVPSLGSDNPFSESELAFNLAWFRTNYQEKLDKATKGPKPQRLPAWQDAVRIQDRANEYSQWMNGTEAIPMYFSTDAELAEYLNNVQLWRVEYEAKIGESTVRRRAMSELKWVDRDEYERLQAMSPKERKEAFETVFQNMAVLRSQADEKRKARQAREEAERETKRLERLASLPERIANWRQGQNGQLGYQDNLKHALLRINGDNIETSQGALFPVEHARLAIKLIGTIVATTTALTLKHHEAEGQTCTIWQKNGHSIKLGHYAIDSITCDGIIKAGCHYVQLSEVQRLALELGCAMDVTIANKDGE